MSIKQFLVRIDADLHQKLKIEAATKKTSINAILAIVIAKHLKGTK